MHGCSLLSGSIAVQLFCRTIFHLIQLSERHGNGCYILNQLVQWSLRSLETLRQCIQPRTFGSVNRVETLDSASNYYIIIIMPSILQRSKPKSEPW